MKQKNLVLMVVAIGCGLVAAFLTAQMSAKPKTQEVALVEVLVTNKELPTGTKFTVGSLKDQVKRKKVRQEEVKEGAILSEVDLIDRQLTKTLKANEELLVDDTTEARTQLIPPQGKDLITVRLPVDKVTPFIKPGHHIDLIGTGVTRSNKVVGMMVLPDVLVMAVDVDTKPSDAAAGRINIQMTTLAVNTEEAMLIRMCETANVQLSYILRSEEAGGRSGLENWSKEKVIRWLENQQADNSIGLGNSDGGGSNDTPQPVSGPQMVKLPVPMEDLPVGTEITADLIKNKFKDAEFVSPAPENAVVKIEEHVGKYIREKVYANQFLSRSCIGNKPEEPKVEVAPETPKPEVPQVVPPKKKRDTFDRTLTTAEGTRRYRFELQDDGEWKVIGEVNEDGTLSPIKGAVPGAKEEEEPAPQPRNEAPRDPIT